MYEIKNPNNFPLTINLKGDASIHLGPFEQNKEIKEEDFGAPDLQTKIKRKLVTVTSRPVVKEEVKEEIKQHSSSPVPNKKIKKEEGIADGT